MAKVEIYKKVYIDVKSENDNLCDEKCKYLSLEKKCCSLKKEKDCLKTNDEFGFLIRTDFCKKMEEFSKKVRKTFDIPGEKKSEKENLFETGDEWEWAIKGFFVKVKKINIYLYCFVQKNGEEDFAESEVELNLKQKIEDQIRTLVYDTFSKYNNMKLEQCLKSFDKIMERII